jgi:hypothetical protein
MEQARKATPAALPPVYRDIKRLVKLVEEAVCRFGRYYKYTLGTDLRQQAMKLMRLVHRAWRDKAHQLTHLQNLLWVLDDFRLTLQLAKELAVFNSFATFEALALLTGQIGKQCGGWFKALQASA